MLRDLRDKGKAVILSTHQMNQIEELGDRILMIDRGRAVLYGDLAEIKSRHRGHSVFVKTEEALAELQGVEDRRPFKDSVELILDGNTTPQHVLGQLLNQGKTVNRFEVATPSLNEIFLKTVGNHDE
jgi:ABC-2 type transport system ATP-binding protein